MADEKRKREVKDLTLEELIRIKQNCEQQRYCVSCAYYQKCFEPAPREWVLPLLNEGRG